MNGRNEGEVGKDPQGDWETTGAEARAGDKRSPAAEREDEDGRVKGRRRDVERRDGVTEVGKALSDLNLKEAGIVGRRFVPKRDFVGAIPESGQKI